MNRRLLGRSGIEVSELGIGTGTNGYDNSSDQVRLGQDAFVALLRSAFEQGVTFWDLADGYGSHHFASLALQTLPRKEVVITSKTGSRKPADIRKDAYRFLKELGTDYLDILLLHCLMEHDWPTRYADCMEEMDKLKAEGIIRAVGCSCHDFGALKATSECNWVDVNLARINYAGKHMEAAPDEVIPVLRKMIASGKGVYGMKVVGCGELGHDAENAIHYVLGLGCVNAITVGMKSEDEIRGNVRRVESFYESVRRAA